MAVGYQYQNEYNHKQDGKGFKKKLIILGAGLALLVVIAIIGAPKKEQPVTTSTETQQTEAKPTELPVKKDYILTDEQKKIKLNTDGFLLSLVNKADYQSYLVPLVYSAIKGKPSLLDTLSSQKLESCILENIEKNDNIDITTYGCSGFSLFISTSNYSDEKTLNKIINWKILK